MQTGKVHIWNMALGFVGTRSVASEDEVTPEAQQCALYWDSARRQALRDYPWNWAQRRVALAEQPMPEAWAAEWAYAYALPTKCLKLHRVIPEGKRPPHDACRVPCKLVHGDDGATLILTQAPAAWADYTSDVPEVAFWDDLFVGLMARKLAAMVAVSLLKNNQAKVQELEQLYRAALPAAFEGAASEQQDTPQPDTWLLARGGAR